MTPQRTALVTAGSAGLGAAIARVLVVDLGMSVVINYSQNAQRAEEQVRLLSEAGASHWASNPPVVRAIQADLTKRSDVIRLVEETAKEFGGKLDVVISNVGWTRMRNFFDLDDGLDDEDWDRCFTVNVKSHLWLFHAARKFLDESNAREEGGAVFISTASLAGVKPSGSSLPYSVTKAALIHLIKSLAVIASPSIRVNSVAPGLLLTEWGQSFPAERIEAIKAASKLGRTATVEDVAEQVRAFVLSKGVTGQTLVIDGGFSL